MRSYKDYLSTIDGNSASLEKRILPNALDAMDMPCMRNLLTSKAPNVQITKDQYAAIVPALFAESTPYHIRVATDLIAMAMCRHSKIPKHLHDHFYPREDDPLPPGPVRIEMAHFALSVLGDSHELFQCKRCCGQLSPEGKETCYSYIGLLEHRQRCHSLGPRWRRRGWWDAASGPDRWIVPFVLKALPVVDDRTTHDEIDRLWSDGKRPVCSCGKRFDFMVRNGQEWPTPRCDLFGEMVRRVPLCYALDMRPDRMRYAR